MESLLQVWIAASTAWLSTAFTYLLVWSFFLWSLGQVMFLCDPHGYRFIMCRVFLWVITTPVSFLTLYRSCLFAFFQLRSLSVLPTKFSTCLTSFALGSPTGMHSNLFSVIHIRCPYHFNWFDSTLSVIQPCHPATEFISISLNLEPISTFTVHTLTPYVIQLTITVLNISCHTLNTGIP